MVGGYSTEGPKARKLQVHQGMLRPFVTGRPSDLYDRNSPDWAPTVNLGHEEVNKSDCQRYDRMIERESKDVRWKVMTQWMLIPTAWKKFLVHIMFRLT